MTFTASQLGQLKTELTTDPTVLGYATFLAPNIEQDQPLADALNLIRTGTNAGPAILVHRSDIASEEILLAILVSDYTALPTNPTNAQLSTERRYLSWLEALTNIPIVRLVNDDGTDTQVIANLKQMFAAGTGTLTRLQALSQRNGSRAEQLFGTNTAITSDDVAKALRG